jgi:hypothetical protein
MKTPVLPQERQQNRHGPLVLTTGLPAEILNVTPKRRIWMQNEGLGEGISSTREGFLLSFLRLRGGIFDLGPISQIPYLVMNKQVLHYQKKKKKKKSFC